ncbi:hypothetical protein BKA56DRAFT_575808 [Ilyonectria sp. MPI-CAGE-AT-0026]|nr:hypothetical protein BKA56DRAFT_575808 [Ilyonectria sp. MPI-CAGE-AT-0026]
MHGVWAGFIGLVALECASLSHLIPRPRGLARLLPRPRPPRVLPLPLDEVPRAAGSRDWRASGVANFDALVVVGGFSMKEVSVVLQSSQRGEHLWVFAAILHEGHITIISPGWGGGRARPLFLTRPLATE